MSSILREKWFWITIIAIFLIVTTPLVVIWIILLLPYPYNLVATVLLIVAWGVAAGYKEWVIEKHKEKEKEIAQA